jgi:MFS family permease
LQNEWQTTGRAALESRASASPSLFRPLLTFRIESPFFPLAGETIEVRGSGGTWVSWSGCKAEHIVTGALGMERSMVMRTRTQAAMDYWAQALKVKPVQDDIVIDNFISNIFGLPANTAVPDADLVMIMTARPSPFSPIAGFAGCYQRDQRGRCTVGQFNWVPDIFSLSQKDVPDTIESELHTALHEVMHLLGGIGPGYSVGDSTFIDETGSQRSTGVFAVEDDPAYPGSGKKRTMIVTPKLAEVVKRDTGCEAATGLPLEDVPLGKGSHWEARLMGPELMSYGSGSGQPYVSDASLAFLEDTNQYIVNYSMAGPLLPAQVDDFKTLNSLSFLRTNDAPEAYVPPPPRTIGALRWGRNQGCSFIDGAPMTSWPSRYLCSKHQAYTCTPDNRMAAVCIVRSDWTVEQNPTCGDFRQDGSGPQCNLPNDNCNGATCELPSYMQHYATDAEAASASGVGGATTSATGGYNNAMDYLPLRVGYWNCMYAKPSGNESGSLGGEGGGLEAFKSLFGSATDMEKFGGQARCENCRCFESSLMEIGLNLNPNFPVYGLCYRANCYRPDYLQIAIRGQITGASFWYKCPAEGGKLYIPGFSGAFHCPKAAEFCEQETISGIKYPEEDPVLEAAFWGTLMLLFVLCMSCCLCRCCRDRCIDCGKNCCGARVWEEKSSDPDEDPDAKLPLVEIPKCAAWLLFAVNIVGLICGICIFSVAAYGMALSKIHSIGVTFLGMGFLIMMASTLGVCGSRTRARRGPSCWVLCYFFVSLLIVVLMIWASTWNLAFSNYSGLVDKYWDSVADMLPADYRIGTREEQVSRATALVEQNFKAIGGLVIAIAAMNLVCLVAAAAIIKLRVLVAMNIVVVGQFQLVFGIILAATGFYLITAVETVGGSYDVVGLTIGAGMILIILGLFGMIGIFKKRVCILALYIALTVISIALCVAATYVFVYRADVVTDYVNGLDEKMIGGIATAFGLAMTKEQLIAQMKNNLHQLALTSGVAMINLVILLLSAVLFLVYLRQWKQSREANKAIVPSKVAGPGAARQKAALTTRKV